MNEEGKKKKKREGNLEKLWPVRQRQKGGFLGLVCGYMNLFAAAEELSFFWGGGDVFVFWGWN